MDGAGRFLLAVPTRLRSGLETAAAALGFRRCEEISQKTPASANQRSGITEAPEELQNLTMPWHRAPSSKSEIITYHQC